MKALFIIGVMISLPALCAETPLLYVQSIATNLKEGPKGSSTNVAELKRGDELTVLKVEGSWVQVKTNSQKEGWVLKVLTSPLKPIGQAQLLKDTASVDSTAKTSRRRTTDYAVSAATRGLSASERHRPGDENFRSNRKAVEEIEKVQISAEKLKKFKDDGKLSE